MFRVDLTEYGQSLTTDVVTFDGVLLLYDKIEDVQHMSDDVSSYSVNLDIEASGSIKNNTGNVLIHDMSPNEYSAKTILFYRLADNGDRRIVAGYSQNTPIVQKRSENLHVYVSFDFTDFTNGVLFSLIQSGCAPASHNTDGILHIENPDIDADDKCSVYSKPQIDELLSTVAKTGSYTDLSNKPNIPSKVSDLTNDSGFITLTSVPTKTSDLTNDSNFVASTSLSTVATSGSYDDLDDLPTIPSTVAELSDSSNYALNSSLSRVAKSGSYNDLSNKPSIPSNVSDLTNDTGFITSSDLPTNHVTTDTEQEITGTKTISEDDLIINDEKIADYVYKHGEEFIVGTQTASTSSWTGKTKQSALYEGMCINYFLPYTSASAEATLELTLPNESTTGAIRIRRNGGSIITSAHAGVGSVIQLTYLENRTIGSTKYDKVWKLNEWYDANTNYYDRYLIAGRMIADTGGIFGSQICLRTGENLYESICKSYSTTANKSRNEHGFYLDSLLYYSSSTALTAGGIAAASTSYRSYPIDLRYSINQTSSTVNAAVYLVCTYDRTDHMFYLAETWWSQSLPTSKDGKYYVYLGIASSATAMNFEPIHPIFYHNGTRVVETNVANIEASFTTISLDEISRDDTDYESTLKFGPSNDGDNIELSLYPSYDNYCYIGTPSNHFYKIFSNNFYGDLFSSAVNLYSRSSDFNSKEFGSFTLYSNHDSSASYTDTAGWLSSSSSSFNLNLYKDYDEANASNTHAVLTTQYKDNYLVTFADHLWNLGTDYRPLETVYAYNFVGSLSGNATTATSAVQDGDGNIITSKYCTLDTDQTLTGSKTFNNSVIVSSSSNLYVIGYNDTCGIRLGDSTGSVSYPMIVGESWQIETALRQNYYIEDTIAGTIETRCDSSGNLTTRSAVGRSSYTDCKWSLGTNDYRLDKIHSKNSYSNTTCTDSILFSSEDSSSLSYSNGLTFSTGNLIPTREFTIAGTRVDIDLGSSDKPFNYTYTRHLRIPRGNCATAASTVAKVVNCTPTIETKDLVDGLIISVYFTNSNTATNPTLNVNSTGDKAIYQKSSTHIGNTEADSWSAGEEVLFIYRSGYWYRVGRPAYSVGSYSNTGNFLPATASSYNLGASSTKWNYLYANYVGSTSYRTTGGYFTTCNATNLIGTLGTLTNNARGGLYMLYITAHQKTASTTDPSLYLIKRNSLLTSNSNITIDSVSSGRFYVSNDAGEDIRCGTITSTEDSTGVSLTSGSYTLLTPIKVTSTSVKSYVALALRTT